MIRFENSGTSPPRSVALSGKNGASVQAETEMKKTKITATIGPTSNDPKTFTELAEAGMNVARLNMSHGTHE